MKLKSASKFRSKTDERYMFDQEIEKLLEKKILQVASSQDPAHDILHFKRVVKTAKFLCNKEKAKFEVVIPAAWLHDLVIIPKNDSRRDKASKLSAEAAIVFLKEISYPEIYFDEIFHAIESHSFSAKVEPKTLEAQIVQDADRLDGLGAIGIARCFATAGLLQRSFYSEEDPFCQNRKSEDSQFTVDHFFAKLFNTAENLKTETARQEGKLRLKIMQKYLSDLANEIQ